MFASTWLASLWDGRIVKGWRTVEEAMTPGRRRQGPAAAKPVGLSDIGGRAPGRTIDVMALRPKRALAAGFAGMRSRCRLTRGKNPWCPASVWVPGAPCRHESPHPGHGGSFSDLTRKGHSVASRRDRDLFAPPENRPRDLPLAKASSSTANRPPSSAVHPLRKRMERNRRTGRQANGHPHTEDRPARRGAGPSRGWAFLAEKLHDLYPLNTMWVSSGPLRRQKSPTRA